VEGDDSDLLPELLDNYLNHETIICPVCLRLPACRVSGYLTCGCGLHFPLPANIDLQDLESLVMTCSELHNDSCQEVPVFSVRQSGPSLQFVSSCEVCQMESVILEPQSETGGASMESD
jgi:hypothetical protein